MSKYTLSLMKSNSPNLRKSLKSNRRLVGKVKSIIPKEASESDRRVKRDEDRPSLPRHSDIHSGTNFQNHLSKMAKDIKNRT